MDNDLVTLSAPHSPAAEAYRALRVNLTYATLDFPLATLVVSASAPEKGGTAKSTVAANLAVVAAQAGQRVVLVDGDLRRPALHALFDLPNEGGLTQAVIEPEAQWLVETEVPNLYLLPTGVTPPNPTDILESQRMDDLLEVLKEGADLVILDAPPVTVAMDAAVLGAKTDGVVLAVRSGHTRRDHLREAKAVLERFDVNLLGAVLVDAPHVKPRTDY
jgi:non-specific protein-tyrosine kinase